MRNVAQVVIQTAAHQNGNGQARLDAVLLCTLLAAGCSLADGEDLRDGEADGGCDVQAQRRAFLIRLDMLEPGTIMLKWVGIFLLIGLALELLRWKLAAAIAFGFSGALFLLLLILLAIETHQDRVLNEIAAQKHRGED